MALWELWTFLIAPLCEVVWGAILLLLALNYRRDALSRALVSVIACIAIMGFFGCLATFLSRLGLNITFAMQATVIGLGALPLCLTVFTIEYLQIWTPLRRKITKFSITYVASVAVATILQLTLYDAKFDAQGLLLTTRHDPLSIELLLVGFIYMLYAVYLIVIHYKRKKDYINKSVAVGVIMIVGAVLTLWNPELIKYSVGTVSMGIGALLISSPILRERLFDPLMRLTDQLKQSADQLNAMMRVGQKAVTILQLDPLLQAVVTEVRVAFDYEGVDLYLWEANQIALKATTRLPSNPGSSIDPVPIRVPFRFGNEYARDENAVEGILVVWPKAFAEIPQQTMDALQVLATQIAIAIRNAQLFQKIQEASDAKTLFLEFINHEVRTPLQTIIPKSQYLQQPERFPGVALSDAYRSHLAAIEQSAQHLKTLLNNSLDLAKIEAGKLELNIEPIDPIPLLNAATREAEILRKDTVQISAAYPLELPQILGDEMCIRQVLLNLVSNACKFCTAGSITLNAQVISKGIHFSVCDTGIGIPLEAQPLMFSRFEQVRKVARHSGGSGLGLHICRELVRLHSGEIGFESVPEQGSTFFFTIPLASPIHTHGSKQPDAIPSNFTVFGDQGRVPSQILVIDAEAETSGQFQIAAVSANYRTLVVNSVPRGVRLARLIEPILLVMVNCGNALIDLIEQLSDLPEIYIVQFDPSEGLDLNVWLEQTVSQLEAKG